MPRVLDPRLRVPKPPKDVILFAQAQSQGKSQQQEDVVVHFNDECFVCADGVSGFSHSDVAAALAGETALWAYRQVRLRHFYWADKRLLIRRIFRTTNLTLWQKRRESGFADGLVTTLLVAIVGPRAVWIGSVGDTSAFFFQDGKLMRVTRQDRDSSGNLTKALGVQRYGIVPHNIHQRFVAGDALLLATDGITQNVTAQELTECLGSLKTTQQSLSDTVVGILRKAQEHGGIQNMTVCLIKRVALPR